MKQLTEEKMKARNAVRSHENEGVRCRNVVNKPHFPWLHRLPTVYLSHANKAANSSTDLRGVAFFVEVRGPNVDLKLSIKISFPLWFFRLELRVAECFTENSSELVKPHEESYDGGNDRGASNIHSSLTVNGVLMI